MTDLDYMRRAIALAKQGLGWTNPNPLVGCVIVKTVKSLPKVTMKRSVVGMRNVMPFTL
ncbi:riboflavin biosynthesis protein [Actinobacillus equuli]|nr:riboflavin biosynthesis protein [Actinobacillus equuli]